MPLPLLRKGWASSTGNADGIVLNRSDTHQFRCRQRQGSHTDDSLHAARLHGCGREWVFAVGLIVLVFSMSGGCANDGENVGEEGGGNIGDPVVTQSAVEPTSVFERPVRQITLEFRIHRFSAEAGAFSSNTALWRIVTGTLPDAQMAMRLADNGFIAVVGRESDRVRLREWLDGLEDIRSVVDMAVPDISRKVEVELGGKQPRRTIFHFGKSGSLHGLDLANAQAKLELGFELRAADFTEVLLTVVPVMEEPPGRPKWVMTPDGAMEVPQERRHPFHDLGFSVEISEGGFLLLGPTAMVYDLPLLGRPFFLEPPTEVQSLKESRRESIYVISPIIRSSS